MPPSTPGFSVVGSQIVDDATGDPVTPAEFNERSTPAQKDQILRDFTSRGLMTNQRGEMGQDQMEAEDAAGDVEASAVPVSRAEPSAPMAPREAPSLQEFLKVARPRNPKSSTKDLAQYWNETYGHVDPKELPSLETFLPAAKEKNPNRPEHELKAYWEDHYGVLGASEKNAPAPGFLGTAKDLALKTAAGVVDVAQSAVGLASLASGGKAGEILRGLGWDPESANKFLNSKTSEAQQVADKATSDATGFVNTVIAYAKNPRAIAGGLAEAAPGIATMGLAARKAATMIAEKAAAAFGGIMTAEGAAAAEKAVEAAAGKLMWVSSGTEGALSAGQIADQAQGAGRQYSDYLLPSLAGGAGTALIGRGAGKVMGGSAEIPTFTGSNAGALTGNWATRTAKSIFSEGFLEEMPQSAQEQVFQNLAMGKPWNQNVPEAAAAGMVIGSTMGGVMGGVQRPTPPPPDQEPQAPPQPEPAQAPHGPYNTPQGPQQPQPLGPNQPKALGPFQPQAEGPQQPKALGPDLPQSLGPQLEKALGPSNEPQGPYRPTVKDVIAAGSIDEAISIADGLLNSADVAFLPASEKRAGSEIPVLPTAKQGEPSLIEPGQVFTPRVAPDVDPREAIAAERAKIVAMRNARTPQPAIEPTSSTGSPAPTDAPIPTQIEQSFPTAQKVREQAHAQGVNADVLNVMGQQMTGKASVEDLSPAELQRLSVRMDSIQSPETRPPSQEKPGELFKSEPATAPLPVSQAVKVPRSELAHDSGLIPERDLNALITAIDAEHRGGDRTADWYKQVTTGKNKLTHDRVDEAVSKIIADQGQDVGKDVEKVKSVLLSAMPSQPDTLESGNALAAPPSPEGLAPQPSPGTAPIETEKAKLEKSRQDRKAAALIEAISKLDNRLARWQAHNNPVPESDRIAVRALADQANALPDEVDASLRAEAQRNAAALQNAMSRSDSYHGVKPGQQEIAVPPPTIGERPIIGREPAPGEAPLFSLSAQEPDVEQGGLSFDLPTDAEAHEAATSPENARPEPTDAQKKAGNYKKGHITIAGMDISIENPEGSYRYKIDIAGLEEIVKAFAKSGSPDGRQLANELADALRILRAGEPDAAFKKIAQISSNVFRPFPAISEVLDGILDKAWQNRMTAHYGYILGTVGNDKDHLDVFIKPGTPDDYDGMVYVIDQNKADTKRFDEHKIVLGVGSSREARELYLSNYAKDWNGLGSMSAFSMSQFKRWLEKGDHTAPAVSYNAPKPEVQAERDKLEAMRTVKDKLPDAADKKTSASLAVASYVETRLKENKTSPGVLAFSLDELYKRADYEFGGTQAEGAYAPKDAFDAIELGVNQYILQQGGGMAFAPSGSVTHARLRVDAIRKYILDKIPGQQNRRTAEQDEFQQFSTPPDLAFVMAWVTNMQGERARGSIRDSDADVVIEPSAGLGGLAVFAINSGATVYANEYNKRRSDLLKSLPLEKVFVENAEQLNNILPANVTPTVILMNPPFSSTAGRIPGERKSSNSIAHLEQAMKRLAPGGRMVALIGKGKEAMGGETSRAVEAWIAAPGKTLLARIGVSGKGYKKYGTTYDNQILIFDKMESAGHTPVIANVEDIRDAIPLLKEVRDARVYSSRQPTADQPGSEAAPRPSEGAHRPGQPVPPATDSLGARPTQGARPDRSSGPAPSSGGRGAQSRPAAPTASPQVSDRDTRPGGRGEQPQLGQPAGQGPQGSRVASDRRAGPSAEDGERRVPTAGHVDAELAADPLDLSIDPADVGGLSDAVYETYRPKKLNIPGAKPHPGELVESAAMNAVDSPDVTYKPDIPQSLITDGSVSIAQMEPVIAAGQAHEKILPSGVRQGFFIGDGTGVGKGREISTIILDNFRHGRQKALWVSMKPDLITDAKRDWSGIQQDPDQIFGTTSAKTPISNSSGILFATYAGLYQGTEADRGGALSSRLDKKGDGTSRVASRLDQIVAWLGHDFDGVIAFDEAHAMGNASPDSNDGGGRGGAKEASLTGLVGMELQKRLPMARVVYVSATGATEVANLAYAERLGLWGEGTAFPDRNSFIGNMKEGGLAAMELVAQNLKAMGLYLARQLSFRGVTYDKLEHKLTDNQRVMYDEIARAWQLVFRNMDAALKITGGNENARTKGAARGRFWSTQLGFYNQLLTSMLMPSVLADVQRQVDQGHAVVLQLVNTNEALAKRTRADAKQEGLDMDSLDLTPKRMLLEYVDRAFPTQQFEQVMGPDGKVTSQPVVDSQGRPVESAEAVAMKDALLRRLADLNVPEGALEQLLDTFGEKMVAEVTGRQTRDIRVTDAEGNTTKVSQVGRSHKMRQADAKAFMDDKKQILVFSAAGGTGMSYHADLSAKNQRKRIHYLIQPGWRADGAVQGFGRTHRSNQKQPPHYILATTDLKGHKRFISSVARRLNQLGALTKGQRQTGGQGFFSEEDNLEGPYAAGAMRALFMDLLRGRVEGMGWADVVEQRMGLDNLIDKRTGTLIDEKIPKLTQFMNRILSLEVDEQNKMFEAFHDRMRRAIELAASKGELDTGMENLDAAGVTLSKEETVYIHPESQSKTKLLDFEVTHNISFVPFEEAQKMRNLSGFVVGKKSGKVFAEVRPGTTSTDKAGDVHTDIILRSTVHGKTIYTSKEKVEKNYEPVDTATAKAKWNEQIKAVDPTYTETVHLLSGTMLPIWDRLPEGFMRVMRVQEDNGRRWIGRIIESKDLAPMKKRLGVEAEGQTYTPESAIAALNAKTMGAYIVLSNDWKIYRRRVNQELRYELSGKELNASWPELSKAGVFSERINYQPRYFLPSGRAADILKTLTQYRKIVDVVGEKDRDPIETTGAADDEDGISSAQVDRPMPVRSNRQANLDPMPDEAQAVQAGIEGKTALQAAQFLGAHAPNQSYREIAQRVESQIRDLERSGMTFELEVFHIGDMAPGALALSRAINSRKFGSNVSTLSFNGADVRGKVGMSYQTVLHELIHAVTQTAVYVGTRHLSEGAPIGKLGDELIALNNAVVQHFNQRINGKAELTTFEQKVHAGLSNALSNPDELLAWGLTNPEMQAFLETIPYKTSTLWNAFVDTIRRFLGLPAKANTALSEILRLGDALLNTPASSYASMASEARLPITESATEKSVQAQTGEGITRAHMETGTIDTIHAKDRLAAATTTARPYLLGSLGLHQLATVYGKDHREVANYNAASQKMETDFVEITRSSDEILKQWDKLKVTVADRMARVMEQARFANYDPDPLVNKDAPENPSEQAVRTAFNGLPDDAKAVYRASRDFYSALANRRFDAIAGRIERAGGTPENRRAAIDKLRLAYDQVRAKVYFPFTRFGDHIVIARKMVDGAETDREVSAFESPLEAQQFATMMKARGWKVKQTMAKEYSRDSEGAASKAVRDILNVVNGIDETTDAKHQLLDAINQTFINSLPDMSYAKHFTHAKEVKGFSKDALRAFAHSAMHGAHHISRIQNADHLTRALATMDERINKTEEGDVTEARQVHNELTTRHNGLLDPNTSPVSAWLGQLGFTMSLGGVIATGVTNATQVPLVTFPWLGSRYGFGKAGAALGRAYKDFLDPSTLNAYSLFDASQSQRLTPGERAMLKELQRRGRIDLTQTMDLSGRASQDNLSRVARQHGSLQDKIAKMLGFTFHAPEVMNRQVTALATYRMEMTRGDGTETSQQRQERAINQAETVIIDTHFIYTQENRPRYMSGNVMRVLTMFKQYGQNIAFLYGRSAQLWLTKTQATEAEKAIAKKQLISMAGLQFAAAGALGMPFVGTVASLLTAILNGFGDDDDKKDWEVELRKLLAEAFGKEAGEVLSHGASRLTPWDMSARLGQSDLFFRAPQREREGRAAAMDWVTALSGPVLGYAVNAYLGVGDVTKGIQSADQGHFLRGVEEMTPAVIRNGVKALRYEMEDGIKTRDGHTQLDLDGAEKLGQFFGFAPSRGAEMYESTNAIKNAERHLAQARAELLDDYAKAYESRDAAARQQVIEHVRAFNLKHREMAINGDALTRSLKGRMRREQGTVGGVYLPRKREGLRQEGSFATF